MKIQKSTNSSLRTQAFAREFARSLLAKIPLDKTALVIGLEGCLGSGKTTFAQGFAKGLGIKDKITSPTFVIFKKFKIKNTKYKIQDTKYFYHIDCYRLKKPKELLDLGWKKIIADPQNIVLVEWAERVKTILPRNTTRFKFIVLQNHKRNICMYS